MNEIDQVKQLLGKFYLIEEDEDGMPQPIHELDRSEYDELRQFSMDLYKFKYFERKIIEIQLNYDEYFNTIQKYEEILFSLEKDNRSINNQLDLGFIDINRVFINFISSFKSFLEHFEMRLIKKYGKDSEVVNNFKRFNSENYDKMIAHRLFVRLRNYAHHDDFPINHVEFDVLYSNDNPAKGEISTFFDREKLMKSEYLKMLKLDLSLMNYKFPVNPYMKEIQKYISKLLGKIIEIEFNNLEEAATRTLFYLEKTYAKDKALIGYLMMEGTKFIWELTKLEIETSKYLLDAMKK